MDGMTIRDIMEATGGSLLCGCELDPVRRLCIDSRSAAAGDLFIPLVGERTDAHLFIGQALENGASAVLTSRHSKAVGEKPWIRVPDTKRALQDIGAFYRQRLSLPLIGITGSVGKTTTRELTACALAARYRVFRTPNNRNSQVGLPLTITEISREDAVGVLELGMSEPGELSVISRIAQVQMAVITNIGLSHIEQLGSQENILREKMSIQDGMPEGSLLFLNGDDLMLREKRARAGRRTIFYGTGENCDYRAADIKLEEGFPVFTAVHGSETACVSLSVMGLHNVQNAMAAMAVAREMGVPMKDSAVKLKEFSGFQGRQQVFSSNGVTVIDDSYNASPASMRAAIDVLLSMKKARRRIAVLADMKELGEHTARYHYEIGRYLSDHPVDELVVLGELAGEIARGASENRQDRHVHVFTDLRETVRYLENTLEPGDCVLLKGSNSMRLGDIASRWKREQ